MKKFLIIGVLALADVLDGAVDGLLGHFEPRVPRRPQGHPHRHPQARACGLEG